MALIAMAVWDTDENNRSVMTQKTIESLWRTIDFNKHRLVIVDNASCEETRKVLLEWHISFGNVGIPNVFTVITNSTNRGTARAINQGWAMRQHDEFAIKMDNDVIIHQSGWVDILQEAIERDPRIGIAGLKRKDCMESPQSENPWYKSSLHMLPHKPGDSWIVVETVNHVMGTCQMYSPALLEKIGYLYQMGGLYGFDDALACIRAHLAGFLTVFLSTIQIDHLDPGSSEYTTWKQDYGWKMMQTYEEFKAAYISGNMPIWHGPSDE